MFSVPSRMVVGDSVSISSRFASLGAAGSVRLELPETARVLVAMTTSEVSTSVTVRLPVVVRPALVSLRVSLKVLVGENTAATVTSSGPVPVIE